MHAAFGKEFMVGDEVNVPCIVKSAVQSGNRYVLTLIPKYFEAPDTIDHIDNVTNMQVTKDE